MTLVITILLLISTILLIIIIWKVHKVTYFNAMSVVSITITITIILLLVLLLFFFHKQHKLDYDRAPPISTAEKKLILVLSLSIFAGLVFFISVATTRVNVTTQVSFLSEYFRCESNGYVPGKCNRQVIQQDSIVWFTSAAFIILGATPLINLLFVVNFKTIKEKVKKIMPTESRMDIL